MSNKQKGYVAEDFTHVTPALLARVQAVVDDKIGRRYSTSKIYKAHNELFKLKEVQQNCETCLINRATALQKWLDWYSKHNVAEDVPQVQIPVANVGPDGQGDPNLVTGGAPDSLPLTVPQKVAAMVGDDGLTNEQRADPVIVNPTDVADIVKDPTGEAAAASELAKTPVAPPIILQKIDAKTYEATGEPLYGVFTASADDAAKGTVTNHETGKALAAGTYATEDVTKILAVSVGGHATYKDVPTA